MFTSNGHRVSVSVATTSTAVVVTSSLGRRRVRTSMAVGGRIGVGSSLCRIGIGVGVGSVAGVHGNSDLQRLPRPRIGRTPNPHNLISRVDLKLFSGSNIVGNPDAKIRHAIGARPSAVAIVVAVAVVVVVGRTSRRAFPVASSHIGWGIGIRISCIPIAAGSSGFEEFHGGME